MGILLAVAGISYGFVAAFMPKSYSDSLNRTLAAKARQMAESLEGYSLKNALPLIEEFSTLLLPLHQRYPSRSFSDPGTYLLL